MAFREVAASKLTDGQKFHACLPPVELPHILDGETQIKVISVVSINL